MVKNNSVIKIVTLRVQLLFLMICSMHSVLLHSMENENKNNKQRLEQELQVLRNCTSITVPEQVYWSEDCNKCAWVTIEEDPDALLKKRLNLVLMGLDKNKELNFKVGSWEGYQYPVIDDQVRPLFDLKDGVFCYGYGRFDCNFLPGVLEYSLNCAGEINRKKCCFLPQYCCKNFLNFPILLEAILRSTQVKEFIREEVIDKTYKIEGVILPEDYTTFQQHPFYTDKRLSYDQLNDCLKKVIDDRYAAQQQEKNNANSQEK